MVPPMSNVIMFSTPRRFPRWYAPTTPAAGPDSTQYIGFSVATSTGVRPPFDCMTVSGTLIPLLLISSLSRPR